MSNVEILRPNTMPQSGGWMWNGCAWVPSGQCGQCGCGWDQCQCGCGGWQCQPCPPAGIRGPIIGVTDGSDAAPGEVGEWLQSTSGGNVTTAAPAIFPAGVIGGAMPSAVEQGLTDPGLERMPAEVHRAWVPAEVSEEEATEEEAAAEEVDAGGAEGAGADR